LWDDRALNNNTPLAISAGNGYSISHIDGDSYNKYIVTTSIGGTIAVWDLRRFSEEEIRWKFFGKPKFHQKELVIGIFIVVAIAVVYMFLILYRVKAHIHFENAILEYMIVVGIQLITKLLVYRYVVQQPDGIIRKKAHLLIDELFLCKF
ncbi:unnamed protein product, partial [Brugia pahangi]|uniref:WD_REPEATS_REGION domain-containing protein n=1 Tax=Brugia pahangi TaxID=6280 RepID=A0A0N4TAI1_BRUPA